MRSVLRVTAGLTALCAWSAGVQGQTAQDWSVQGSAIYVVAGGNAFAGTDAGPGIELQLRRNLSQVSFGVGFQYSRHDFEGLPDPLNLVGGFIEPRYVFPGSSTTWAPYASARLAVFQQAISSEGVGASAIGAQVNGGGGVLVRLSGNTNLDLGATFGFLQFGELTVNRLGGTEQYPSSSGTNFVLRMGFAIGLGS